MWRYSKQLREYSKQILIDIYSKVAIAKPDDRKNALVVADLLNDIVIPFYEKHRIPLLMILTDRGTEYCRNRDHHEYQFYLAVENIYHTKKTKSPQSDGICKRFHRTVLQEFYQIAFRKKIYSSIEEIQKDLDELIRYYNIPQ